MKFKKFVCTALALLFAANSCYTGVNALFGNAHFNLGKKIVRKLDKKLSEKEGNAFLSGMVYADIGRFKFDKETGIDSDSDKFAKKMKELAKTDEEKWFARGFEMHVLQDNETKKFLNETLGRKYSSYSEYMTNCGIVDYYFAGKSGILYNEFINEFNFEQIISGWNVKDLSKISGISEDKIKDFVMIILKKSSKYPKKNNLVMYEDLIEKTYNSFGIKVSSNEIHEQAGNLLGVFIIVSNVIGNKTKISEDLALKIEKKSNSLAELCLSKLEF